MPSTRSIARRALSRLGDRGRTTRIPDDVRAVVVDHAREARRAGASWKAIADDLELSASALQRWDKAMAPKPNLRPVVVSDPQPDAGPKSPGSLVLVTAGGERLEGLGPDEAARLLRALR